MTVVMHHQPVLDFHTGLMAKVYEVSKRGGVFLVHDLDTLKESGSCVLRVPKPRGRGVTTVRLLKPRYQKDKLFTVGTVTPANHPQLEQALLSLANGKVRGEFRDRWTEFSYAFPGVRRFRSVAELNISLLEFALPQLGVEPPRTANLSDLLWGLDWQDALRRFLEYYPDYAAALSRCGVEYSRLPFWRRDIHRSERFPVHDLEEAAGLIGLGCLIPKGRELVWLIRVELGYPMIRGLGGEVYEQPLEAVARKLGKRIAPTTTVTSNQGVPEKWRPVVREQNFRPAALLLWLMEGKFDPGSIIRN